MALYKLMLVATDPYYPDVSFDLYLNEKPAPEIIQEILDAWTKLKDEDIDWNYDDLCEIAIDILAKHELYYLDYDETELEMG